METVAEAVTLCSHAHTRTLGAGEGSTMSTAPPTTHHSSMSNAPLDAPYK